jgi:SAM-dependent methyltransferase
MKIKNNYKVRACPFCNSSDIFFKGKISYAKPVRFSNTQICLDLIPELWSCNNCASAFTQNCIAELDAINLYTRGESNTRWSNEKFEICKPKSQLRLLNQYLTEGKKVLDIGANTGNLLDYALSRKCITSAVEYSQTSRDILEKKGHKAYQNLSEIKDKFDVITAFDLVEHLYDPMPYIEECSNHMNNKGFLIILTGDINCISSVFSKNNWWYIKYPEHIRFIGRKAVKKLNNFRLIDVKKTYASVGYIANPVQFIKFLITLILKRNSYTGLPSITPDHKLLILQKK